MTNTENGQTKCPKCGATDIALNPNSGKLRCNFCRHEFEPELIEEKEDIFSLKGENIDAGAENIDSSFDSMVTIKCKSCGAEVVVDTEESTQVRCHWCRNTLSINEKIPNGAVPDMVLPFKIKKEEAREEIDRFVSKRKFFAHPQFKAEFSSENVMGVYFPYMVVDINAKASFAGEGEHETRQYTVTVGSGKNQHTETRYDADLYEVERDFDIAIEGLTIESSADKLTDSKDKTNNIINSIMPFDTENAVKWDANYLKNYTSEKRDTNVEDLKPIVNVEAKDIARFAANDSLGYYDRGVKWNKENLEIKGTKWNSAYLPVWLYSYMEKKGEKSLLHYVAVNARTKETMGSVPIHMPKLLGISALVELLGVIMMLLTSFFVFSSDDDISMIPALFLLSGFIYFFIIFSKYRNKSARHYHETETKREINNLVERDEFIKHKKGLSNSSMDGANNTSVKGSFGKINILP